MSCLLKITSVVLLSELKTANTAERTKTMGIFTDDPSTLPSESNSDKCIGKVYLNDLKGVYIELDKSLTPRELNEILFIEHRVAETKSKDT